MRPGRADGCDPRRNTPCSWSRSVHLWLWVAVDVGLLLALATHRCDAPGGGARRTRLRPRDREAALPASRTSPFSIKVIACDRPASLQRLLDSLQAAQYDGWTVDVDIIVDTPTRADRGSSHRRTVHAARAWRWEHGQKRVKVREQHAGIVRQWLEAWDPLDGPSQRVPGGSGSAGFEYRPELIARPRPPTTRHAGSADPRGRLGAVAAILSLASAHAVDIRSSAAPGCDIAAGCLRPVAPQEFVPHASARTRAHTHHAALPPRRTTPCNPPCERHLNAETGIGRQHRDDGPPVTCPGSATDAGGAARGRGRPQPAAWRTLLVRCYCIGA